MAYRDAPEISGTALETPPRRQQRMFRNPWMLWGVAALVAGAVAFVTGLLVSGATGPQISGFEAVDRQLLLPQLRGHLDAVRAVQIDGKNGRQLIVKSDGGWSIETYGGYRVPAPRIEALIAQVARLEITHVQDEPATGNRVSPYSDFGVADPASEFGAGMRLTFRNENGERIARILIGHVFVGPFAKGAVETSQTFVRRNDDPHIWVVDEGVSVSDEPLDWILRDIIDVPREAVAAMTTVAPDGRRIRISRDPGGILVLREGLPEGKSVNGEFALDWMASALEAFRFDDVRRAGNVSSDNVWRASVATRGGLTFHFRIYPGQEAWWATISVDADGSANAVRAATQLNAEREGWAYRLTPYTKARLTATVDDLVR